MAASNFYLNIANISMILLALTSIISHLKSQNLSSSPRGHSSTPLHRDPLFIHTVDCKHLYRDSQARESVHRNNNNCYRFAGPRTMATKYADITKTCPCNIYPAEPHFYIAKLGYEGVNLCFLFLLQNIYCGYSLEPPRRGGSNVYPQFMF